VQAFAPNPGDLASLATVEPGSVPGWDGAGTMLRNAPNGNGPEEGQSVIFLERPRRLGSEAHCADSGDRRDTERR
jgi:hypothetical protein